LPLWKKYIAFSLLAMAINLNCHEVRSENDRAWRREIDGIIQKKLEAAGFQKFDGISYSFPISDEVLGVVQIYNQELVKYPNASKAIINTRLGVINYQLSVLENKLESDEIDQHEMWQCTLGGANGDNIMDNIGDNFETFDLSKSKNLKDKKAAIDHLVTRITRKAIPVIRKRFRTLRDITNFLKNEKYRDEQLYCLALAANGDIALAKEKSKWISANIKGAHVNKIAWAKFKPRFDQWIADGVAIPKISDAHTMTMKAAAQRQKIINTIPADDKPTW
jgi:hypothetical protein